MTIEIMYAICGVLFISLVGVSFIYLRNNKKYTKGVENVEKFFNEQREYKPGRRGVIFDYRLEYKGPPVERFGVDYEVEIIDVTEENAKVKCIDMTSTDSEGRDPSNRAGIMAFMDNKWVSKSSIKLTVDTSTLRRDKLEKILDVE